MLITKETDYALRILRALAPGGRYSVPQLCKQELLPNGFAYKIVKKLAAAGILSITRGAEGGCVLEADLAVLTLYDVMDAMGDTALVSACMDEHYPCDWRKAHQNTCTVHCRLAAIQAGVYAAMKQYSIASMLSAYTET